MNGRPNSPSSADVARVTEMIRSQRDMAISRAELVMRTGLHDRVVREAIRLAVLAGAPIVSDRKLGGYVFRDDPHRRQREARSLRSHAARLMERANALERYGLPEQTELFA